MLRAGWLFDGTGSAPIPDPVVVPEGSTILGAGSGGQVPHCAALIDLAVATLPPGLVGNHVHLAVDASAGPGRQPGPHRARVRRLHSGR